MVVRPGWWNTTGQAEQSMGDKAEQSSEKEKGVEGCCCHRWCRRARHPVVAVVRLATEGATEVARGGE